MGIIIGQDVEAHARMVVLPWLLNSVCLLISQSVWQQFTLKFISQTAVLDVSVKPCIVIVLGILTKHIRQGTKIFQYCTCPAGQVTYNFHSSCKHMHLSFKSICNKEHTGVMCNITSSSNCSQCTCPIGRVLWEELLVLSNFTRNYEWTRGIFVPCTVTLLP